MANVCFYFYFNYELLNSIRIGPLRNSSLTETCIDGHSNRQVHAVSSHIHRDAFRPHTIWISETCGVNDLARQIYFEQQNWFSDTLLSGICGIIIRPNDKTFIAYYPSAQQLTDNLLFIAFIRVMVIPRYALMERLSYLNTSSDTAVGITNRLDFATFSIFCTLLNHSRWIVSHFYCAH